MPNISSTSLTFYPAYCLPLSPTYNTWARLTAADVHALRERAGYDGQNIYFHLNHPIRWIRLVGIIVALDCLPTRWIMQLDDSCGATIEVTCGRPTSASTNDTTADILNPGGAVTDGKTVKDDGAKDTRQIGLTATGRTIDLTGVDVGAVVKVKGGIGMFRGAKQVQLERISQIPSTNDEVTSWAETSTFRTTILNTPWVISAPDLERATRQAEGLHRPKKPRTEKRKRPPDQQRNPDRAHDDAAAHVRIRKTEPEAKDHAAARMPRGRDHQIPQQRISARDVAIPRDQQEKLDRADSWLPHGSGPGDA